MKPRNMNLLRAPAAALALAGGLAISGCAAEGGSAHTPAAVREYYETPDLGAGIVDGSQPAIVKRTVLVQAQQGEGINRLVNNVAAEGSFDELKRYAEAQTGDQLDAGEIVAVPAADVDFDKVNLVRFSDHEPVALAEQPLDADGRLTIEGVVTPLALPK